MQQRTGHQAVDRANQPGARDAIQAAAHQLQAGTAQRDRRQMDGLAGNGSDLRNADGRLAFQQSRFS